MKRVFCIIFSISALAAMADARDYTYLQPPSIAVADFEVSLSAAETEASKAFYGALVSQALLTALVQQNAASSIKVSTVDSSLAAANGVTAANTGGEEERYYIPPLFNIFDKRYVESALQNAAYTAKDLYTRRVDAFNFTDLDYIVLGNVYETKRLEQNTATKAIGINVRVLDTQSLHEMYSYTAVTNSDLSDLPAACTLICQRLLRDILNSTCAQFIISDNSGVLTPYRLFLQPKQVAKNVNTAIDSNDSNKREIHSDQFYWVLPGQYIISVYNVDTQRIRTIPFTISAGDIKHMTIGKQDIDDERGTLTIGGVLPSNSYTFSVKEQKRLEQYWWELGGARPDAQDFTVTFDNGEVPEVKQDPKAAVALNDKDMVRAEYRPSTNEIVISNVVSASIDIAATSRPSSSEDITGWWKIYTRQISQSSTPLSVDLRSQNDVHLQIADFGLQQKEAGDTPHKTAVTFFINPGFGYDTTLFIDDGLENDAKRISWRNKDKVTVYSEYSQADWDSLQYVTFTFQPAAAIAGVSNNEIQEKFSKADLDPANDTVVIVDMNDEAANSKKPQPGTSTNTTSAPPATVASTNESQNATSTASSSASTNSTITTTPSRVFLALSGGLGYASMSYSTATVTKSSASCPDCGANADFTWHFTPGFGLGLGGAFHICFSSVMAAVVTANMMFGDLSKQNLAYLVEFGLGAGYIIDASLAFMNKDKTGGFLLTAGYVSYDANAYNYGSSHPASAGGIYIGGGYLLGL